ncbi:hypothetical protein F4818DRAFT_145419 [Hypoxylon cercidicola]|nr:hypothetical protein F4818DRAFT_145419 [Hypoxylon cercidicola]
MPKKRHQSKYSKPPSVAPPILSSSSSRAAPEHHERSVNQLLADLRRTSIRNNGAPNGSSNNFAVATTPTVPPSLRQILQIPETPAPAPRRPQRRDANGRRAPPGPPPPRSWVSLAQSRHAPADFAETAAAGRIQHWPLPGAYTPGALVDQVLRRMALDWEQQRQWNQFYLYALPSRLRAALLGYVSEYHGPGVSARDLRLVLAGPADEELARYEVEKPDVETLNADVFYLDLAGSVGRSVTVRELGELLFPPKAVVEVDPQDSWEAPEPVSGLPKLLPNLTQLSLAVDPGTASSVSWKQLLALAGKLPTLTHLSLSGWPEPSLTPNAKFAKVASPLTGRSIQYGGTGPYSHTLDGDWSEAIQVLNRLSKSIYSLEYLDLTGCGDWFPALMKESDGDFTIDFVDWVGNWGKITTLRLNSGYALPDGRSTRDQYRRIADWVESATAVEKHIRAQRAGRGRWITVEKDTLSAYEKAVMDFD